MEPQWHQWLEISPVSLCCSKVTMCCHGEGNLLNMESLHDTKACACVSFVERAVVKCYISKNVVHWPL